MATQSAFAEYVTCRRPAGAGCAHVRARTLHHCASITEASPSYHLSAVTLVGVVHSQLRAPVCTAGSSRLSLHSAPNLQTRVCRSRLAVFRRILVAVGWGRYSFRTCDSCRRLQHQVGSTRQLAQSSPARCPMLTACDVAYHHQLTIVAVFSTSSKLEPTSTHRTSTFWTSASLIINCCAGFANSSGHHQSTIRRRTAPGVMSTWTSSKPRWVSRRYALIFLIAVTALAMRIPRLILSSTSTLVLRLLPTE